LPKDVARQEANHADNERCHAQRQRRQVRSTARATATARGEQTPSVSESIGDNDEEEDEDEEEGEIISSPHSPPPPNLPLPSALFGQKEGIFVGAHWKKRPWTDAKGGSSLQLGLALVCSDLNVCLHWCCKDNSLIRSLVGSITLANHQSCCIHDGEAILVEHRGVQSPHPRRPSLCLSYWCPPGMHVMLISGV
jgi:hypothetical protein